MEKEKKYYLGADIVRVLAIVAVVVIHVSSQFLNRPEYFGSFSWWLSNVIDSFSRVAVPIFIMLSGMLLLDEQKKYTVSVFLKKRFVRVLIPLVVWSVIYILWRIFWLDHTFTPYSLLKLLLKDSAYYHLYFLYIIFGLYLVTPMIRIYVTYASRRNLLYALVLTFVGSLLWTGLNFFLPSVRSSPNALTFFVPYVPYFIAGYYLKNVSVSEAKQKLLWFAYLVLGMVTALGNFWYMKVVGWTSVPMRGSRFDRYFFEHFSPTVVVMSLIIFVLLINLPRWITWLNSPLSVRIVRHLSSLVFGIYLIHLIFLDIIDRYIDPLRFGHIDMVLWLAMVCKIILVFTLSYISVLVLRKIPGMRFIFG